MNDAGAVGTKSGHRGALGSERGATIVLVSLTVAGLLGMVALAVDVGMLFTARSEAQRAADAAALAGAGSLIERPDEVAGPAEAEQRARNIAIDYASQNNVRELMAEVRPEDVQVDLARDRVTVTVRRVGERDNPVGTFFARIFGTVGVDIAARATAAVELANAGTCMKPFTIPDAWEDLDGDGKYDAGEPYVAEDTGYGSDFRNDVPSDNGIDPAGTTYEYDFGRPIVIKEGKPQETIEPSWYFPWDVPQGNGPDTGADRYEWNIANCNTSVVVLGQEYNVENGRMRGKTRTGVAGLISQDSDAYWDLAGDSVANAGPPGYSQPWKSSPRIVNIPLFDPIVNKIRPGKKPVVFNNITAFFIQGMIGDDVVGRFLYASGIGIAGDGPGGGGSGNQAKLVRLVE